MRHMGNRQTPLRWRSRPSLLEAALTDRAFHQPCLRGNWQRNSTPMRFLRGCIWSLGRTPVISSARLYRNHSGLGLQMSRAIEHQIVLLAA